MLQPFWIVFMSLQGMAFCGYASHGVGHGNEVLLQPNILQNQVLQHGAATVGANVGLVGHGLRTIISRSLGTLGSLGHAYSHGLSVGSSTGLSNVHGSQHGNSINGGLNIGNGYLGYSNYHKSRPIVYGTNLWRPVKPTHQQHQSDSFSVTPSISYGYSYKLVPTYAYAPAPAHGHPGGSILNGLFGSLYGR